MNSILTHQLQQLPSEPGIYKYFNREGEIIYVGKAVNLRNRVKSYFVDKQQTPKTRLLVAQIDHLEYIVVQSEVDALILEANLIKEYRPRFNIILKDDKSHLYIKITLQDEWPRISTCRATDMHFDPKATYFGPFPSGRIVKDTLRSLRRIFPYLAHHQPPVPGKRRPPQSYFYYNLPLEGQKDVADKKEYRHQIFQLVRFLEGKRQSVVEDLEKEMRSAAKKLNFEEAAAIKRQLDGMSYITQKTISPESYIANPELMVEKREQGLRELATVLSQFWPYILGKSETDALEYARPEVDPDSPELLLHRIECFDISNISGQQAVGSMVVFEDGEPLKNDYRKFKIKREQAPNDTAMMAEILKRRFKRLKADVNSDKTSTAADASFSSIPDLIMIDGGKGQLSAVHDVLQELSLSIPVVGMTKREEELMVMQDGSTNPNTKGTSQSRDEALQRAVKPKRSAAHGAIARNEEDAQLQIHHEAHFTAIRLARGAEALFLIQRIRDEAHRFAIMYHRKLRAKAFLPTDKK